LRQSISRSRLVVAGADWRGAEDAAREGKDAINFAGSIGCGGEGEEDVEPCKQYAVSTALLGKF
jgi:hypothetical protein